nr:reverse transcriptase domain-containing protein [Tanacetum cinerariifolium]
MFTPNMGGIFDLIGPAALLSQEDECIEETYTNPDLAEYTIKVPPPPPRGVTVNACDNHSSSELAKLTHAVNQQTSAVTTAMMAMLKQFQSNPPPAQVKAVEKIYVTCGGAHPYYQCLAVGGITFSEFRDNIQGYVSAAACNFNQGNPGYRPQCVANQMRPPVLMPKYQKMLKAILSNKEKLQELANTPLNENCSAVILKKLPKKLRDPGKFLILCGFSELKCKALYDLGASTNLMPLSVWKKLGLHDLIPTRMTLKLANCAICTPDGIARDVFVPVGKFTFPADFVVVHYESDLRVPLILGRPFLRIARALIDVHSEEMILRDEDERLTLNMKHDTTSYSNHPHRDSVNLINIFNLSSEDCLEDLVSNKKSGNPTFSLHIEIASSEVIHELHDSKGCTFLSEELPDIDSFNDFHPYFDDDPLSGSTTYSANSLLEEFANELALITYPPDYDDNLTFDVYPDDFLEIKYNADNSNDDIFDSKGEKIKEAELLIDQLDLPCDILSEYDSFNSQDFSRDDDLPSPDNEDKVKENQEKYKIGSKSDKNEKHDEAEKSQKQFQSIKQEKLKKRQVKGSKVQTHSELFKKEESKGLDMQITKRSKTGARFVKV